MNLNIWISCAAILFVIANVDMVTGNLWDLTKKTLNATLHSGHEYHECMSANNYASQSESVHAGHHGRKGGTKKSKSACIFQAAAKHDENLINVINSAENHFNPNANNLQYGPYVRVPGPADVYGNIVMPANSVYAPSGLQPGNLGPTYMNAAYPKQIGGYYPDPSGASMQQIPSNNYRFRPSDATMDNSINSNGLGTREYNANAKSIESSDNAANVLKRDSSIYSSDSYGGNTRLTDSQYTNDVNFNTVDRFPSQAKPQVESNLNSKWNDQSLDEAVDLNSDAQKPMRERNLRGETSNRA